MAMPVCGAKSHYQKGMRKLRGSKSSLDAQLWSELLEASGGALELPELKCRKANFDFCASGYSCVKQPEAAQVLLITNKEGKEFKIKPLPPTAPWAQGMMLLALSGSAPCRQLKQCAPRR